MCRQKRCTYLTEFVLVDPWIDLRVVRASLIVRVVSHYRVINVIDAAPVIVTIEYIIKLFIATSDVLLLHLRAAL